MSKKRNRYTDESRAEALAALWANGGNVARTSREIGVPRRTLALWAKGPVATELAEVCHQKKEDLASSLESVAWKLLEGIDEKKLAAATLLETMKSLAIAIDKMLLLRREPTIVQEQQRPAPNLSPLSDDELDHLSSIAQKLSVAPLANGGVEPTKGKSE